MMEMSLAALYLAHRQRLISWATHSAVDSHTAEDLVQDTFIRLFRQHRLESISHLSESAQFFALRRTLASLVSHHWRALHTQKRKQEGMLTLDDPLAANVTTSAPDPAAHTDLRWALAAAEQMLHQLQHTMAQEQWAALEPRLRGDEEHPVPCRVSLYRARQRLRLLAPELTQEVIALFMAS